jgi:hypothetical protein
MFGLPIFSVDCPLELQLYREGCDTAKEKNGKKWGKKRRKEKAKQLLLQVN